MKNQTVTTYMVGSTMRGIGRVPLDQNCAVMRLGGSEVRPEWLAEIGVEAVVYTNEVLDRFEIGSLQMLTAEINNALDALKKPHLKTVVYGGTN